MIDFSKCKTTKDCEQVLLDKRTQPLSATGCPIDILANTNNGIQPVSRVWKQNLGIQRIVCSPETKSKLNVAVCATTRMKFRSVQDAMFPVARIAVRRCTCVPVVCMTTRTTVAIGIRKPNPAGGDDANESKAF